MTHSIVPHLAIPFRVELNGQAAVLEQDTLEEIAQCVHVVLMTQPGDRLEVPNYGTRDSIFMNGINLSDIMTAVQTWEPRAVVLLDEAPDRFDALVKNITAGVSKVGS